MRSAAQVSRVVAEEGHPEGGFALEVDGSVVGVAHPHGRWLTWTGLSAQVAFSPPAPSGARGSRDVDVGRL